ncbi:HEXXH motif-containing putative peptide modification protein [Streptomyces sp. NPDC059340]|uniref:aKG-HExxH-type peptide beta-hydroxylase n=1 Tax=Streptomyces sp. NPDC059340 TaxID=3346806 RepID=UPI0036C5A935
MTTSADRGGMGFEHGLLPERAAEIIVAMPTGGAGSSGSGRRGSGYLLSAGKVLTAAHVVEGAARVQVRFQADRPGERMVSAVVAWQHAAIDVAILVVPVMPGGAAEGVLPVSFGRVGERDAVVRCTALGFPRFKLRRDANGSRFRDTEHVDATCAVLSNRREGALDLKIASPPAEDPEPGQDAWDGMSGAAVFCNGHLVGVITRHHLTDGPGRIAASRTDRWAEVLTRTELAELEGVLGRRLAPSELPDSSQVTSYGAPPGDPMSPDRIDGALGPIPATPLLPRATAVPLAVPQRRVAPDRLRGRSGLVTDLTDALTRRVGGDRAVPGVWLLSGMGGCGKTTVALETAHQLAGATTRVWWVSGENGEVLSAALRAVAFAAGAQASDFVGSHPADVLWTRLDALTAPWLLILDNVDDPSALAAAPFRAAEGVGWLRPPARSMGTVLITSRESRSERWGRWVHMVGVDLLSDEDGAKVLRDLAPPQAGIMQEARELAEHLGGLPLALNLAGSYLARALEDPWPSPSTPMTFADYRRSFDASLADMTSDPDTDLGPGERSRRAILSTWELSLDLLHRQGTDLARPLLRLLTALGPAPIPYQELLDPELLAESELFTDPTRPRLQEALKGLAGLQLITIELTRDDADGGPLRWITIHPMVRAASLAHADFTAQGPLLLSLVTALLHQFTSPLETGNPRDWPLWRAIAPHCSAALELLPGGEQTAVDCTGTRLVVAATEPAVRAAQYHNYLGLYGEAITELDSLSAVRARLLGDEDPATIATRLDLAWALRENGALTEADRLYQDVARAGEGALPDGHPYLQTARTGRARVLRELGRYEDAEAELHTALDMRRRDPESSPRGILRIQHELATLAYKRERYEEAVTELRGIVRQFKALAGEGDLDALASGTSLVRALREAGHAQEAENVAENVVREYLTVLEPDHPSVLLARHERARLSRDHESDPECLNRASDEFTDIWQINERRFGSDHLDTIAARHELATVWHLLGRPELAAEHYEAVLEAGTRQLGKHHPDIERCARNLAKVRAELAKRESPPTAEGADPNNSDGAEAPQGDIQMDDHWGAQDAMASATPDLTELALEEALSPEPHSDAHPAAARLLARYVRPRLSRAGTDADGGFSESRKRASRSVSYTPASGHRARRDIREYTPWSPFPSPADVRLLATGEEDHALVIRLRAQQRGARALALGELLRLADAVTTDRADETPMISEVRELLLRAERANSEAVATVLLHPSVGRWLSRALGALHTPPGGPQSWSGTPSADLRHLHSVAATAAIKARIAFTLPLPMREGYVFLPGLGAADFRAAGVAAARVVATADSAVVSGGDTEVRLPSPSDPHPTGWIPVNRVRTPVGQRHFDFVLEDMDPYRETDGPTPPRCLSPVDVTRWQRTTRDAGELLADVVPRQAAALTAALTALTPQPEPNGGMMTSLSSSDAFGGTVLSTPPDAVELAVTLVHEFRHMKLNALLDSLDLYDNEGEGAEENLFYAPWRDDPRPLPGFFDGVFAYFGVVDFWRKLAHWTADERLRRRAQFQLVYWRTQTQDAYEVLRSSPHLTAAGRDFTATMGDSMANWTYRPAVPDDVLALAMEAVSAHRTRWRLHHLRPDSDTVAELAGAWMSGAARPSRRHIVGGLAPDFAVPSLNDYTALLCRVTADPSLLHRARAEHGQQEFDRADLTRLLGETDSACRLAADQVTRWPQQHEPWARLGLALRATVLTSPGDSGTAAAARSLAHRPEVVRAVHAHVIAVTGTPPEPIALAAWLGDSTGPAELSDLPAIHPL